MIKGLFPAKTATTTKHTFATLVCGSSVFKIRDHLAFAVLGDNGCHTNAKPFYIDVRFTQQISFTTQPTTGSQEAFHFESEQGTGGKGWKLTHFQPDPKKAKFTKQPGTSRKISAE